MEPRKSLSAVSNPREVRLLMALLQRSLSREALDRVVGCSNSPDHVMKLRRQHNLDLPCQRVAGTDRDGNPVRFGLYSTTAKDRTTIRALLCLTLGEV
jgi:hypothetical protein